MCFKVWFVLVSERIGNLTRNCKHVAKKRHIEEFIVQASKTNTCLMYINLKRKQFV